MASMATINKSRFAPNSDELAKHLEGKQILVTGGTGSFGNAFISAVLKYCKPKRLVILSRDELKQSVMIKKLNPTLNPCLRFFLGDVRDYSRLTDAFQGIDIIVHAAALKQVPALEYNPTEAIKTNINGAMNIIKAAKVCGVKQIIALSTDKAAQPINLYGATKLCSDKLFVASNTSRGANGPIAAVVRYGNVFGSRGSIVPVLHALRPTGVVGLTDVRMTRFNITLEEAVNFVLSNLLIMQGGEIYIPKIPSYKLPLIADAVTPECEVKIIGRRPGEKLHEIMIPADEAYRTVDIGDRLIIEPEGDGHSYSRVKSAKAVPEDFEYHSGNNTEWCTIQELREQYVEHYCKKYGYEIPKAITDAMNGA